MTLQEALTTQPLWVQIWVGWMAITVILMPLVLLIWRQTRLAAIVTLAAAILGALGIRWIHSELCYVRLLGLPHIVFWLPAMLYLYRVQKQDGLSPWAIGLIRIIAITMAISLVFDTVDVIRYLLGERAPF
ncbi:hypothetical protein [Ruegeria jejuensis]|uniref:hypothetical protein n=1 Tax=Ruegeria jejuensis TaxID=3233338 RepID=UPI00355C51E0